MGVEQPAPLGLEDCDLGLGSSGVGFDMLDVAAHGGEERRAEAFRLRHAELDGPVALLDGGFDFGGGKVWEVTARPSLVSAVTEEVVVLAAVAATVAGEAESGLATGAVDGALEVVVVEPATLVGVVSSVEDGLDTGERLEGDDRGVRARVLDTAPGDDADVEGVVQHLEHVLVVDGSGGLALRSTGGEAPVVELVGELAGADVAERVGVEGPGDEWRPFGVDGDGADLLSVHDLAAVEVSERRVAGVDALLGLLVHALGDLGRQVPAVELGDRAHDPVEQGAGRGLVDVLADRDESGAGLGDGEVDADVVGSVAGEAVDLVDDDVLDVLLGEQPRE